MESAMMNVDAPRRRRRVVLVPFPVQGHLTPMLQLGTILHAQGFSITVLHPEFNSPNYSNHPEFTFLRLAGKETVLSPNMFQFISDTNSNCRTSLEEHMVHLLKEQDTEGRVACIIHDSIMKVVDSVASGFNVPTIILRTSSTATLLSYNELLRLREQNRIPLSVSQLEDPVPSLEFLRYKDLPFSVATEMTKGLHEFLQSVTDKRNYKTTILNSVECLEKVAVMKLQQHYQVPVFAIGPFHKVVPPHITTSLIKEDVSCIEWLDKQVPHSVLYVSLGSLVRIDKEELTETAWGLVESEQPFLWVIRPDSVNGSDWAECLPDKLVKMMEERGCIVRWAPQRVVLAHVAVGGFFSHCGWNSTLESIGEGVPLLCRPWLTDQFVNARYISNEWRVGLELENFRDRNAVKSSVKRLLVGEDSKDMRHRALDLKQKLEISVQKGGSSYTSLENLKQFILSL